jgi:SAM-dependent methyltransferase
MDLDQYRRDSHEIWERMAVSWERHHQWVWRVTRAVGEGMVANLDPQPGQTILELAAGTGETGFAAAERIGPDGKLISTDFAAPMVEAARRRADELGLGNVEFRTMDAEQMDLPDNSVDGVLCRFGYMLMADPAAALAETRRVLRDGGRLSFGVWGDALRNPWAAIAGAALVEHGHMPMPEPDAPGIFAMGDPGRIESLVSGASFGEPRIEDVAVEWTFEDFDGYWNFLLDLAGPIATVINGLEEDQRAQVRETMERNAESVRDGGGYVFPGVALIVAAS